jgi:hypothetical protein
VSKKREEAKGKRAEGVFDVNKRSFYFFPLSFWPFILASNNNNAKIQIGYRVREEPGRERAEGITNKLCFCFLLFPFHSFLLALPFFLAIFANGIQHRYFL